MIWIGGAQGAGKSTLAWAFSRAYDLPQHRIDLWTYDHLARLPPGESLDEELARGPEYAAEAFLATSRVRLKLVLADVAARRLGSVPALVEGPQLVPTLAEPLPEGHAVWLIPDPARTRAAREKRLADLPVSGDRARLERLLRRDSLLSAWMRRDALRLGRPVIEVPAAPDWGAIRAAVEEVLAPALRRAPQLEPPQLGEQRRQENATAARQGRLWQEAVGLTAPPSYPFACECGLPRCSLTWRATPDEYELRAALGPVPAPEHEGAGGP